VSFIVSALAGKRDAGGVTLREFVADAWLKAAAMLKISSSFSR
jgi:hypothetical protein